MTKVKICGLTRSEDIECANRVKPDFVGFVFYTKSKRLVSLEQAAALKAQLAEAQEAYREAHKPDRPEDNE